MYPGPASSGNLNDPSLSYNDFALQGPPGLDVAMAPDVNMLASLDMDMSLPMDLDLDLSTAGDPSFATLPPQHGGSTAGTTSAGQDMSVGGDYSIGGGDQQYDVNMAGAGPLPTSYGAPTAGAGSGVTEFTKRRNWSQRIVEEIKDFLHVLTPDGRILYASPSCKLITGHDPRALVGKFISEYVHPDDSGIFMREFNESIASGNTLRFFYRFKKEDGDFIIFECDGHPHISADQSAASVQGQAADVQGLFSAGVPRGFFMMARPYPTRNAALLDSFLEHKIENERLKRRVEELKREEQEENAEQDRLYQAQALSQAGAAHYTGSQPGGSQQPGDDYSASPMATPNYQGMPPPAKPSTSNIALTRQNLDSVLSAQRPDSIADKMSRYEANSTHLESIELLTGLRYRDGERSHGISTGDTSPALIRGDAGIAILLDRDREASKKEKKRNKAVDEYVCADCGTLDSPEWRKGPKGPKTLCNACGLRWAKKEKKRGGDEKNTSPSGISVGGMAAQQPLPPAMDMGMSGSTPMSAPKPSSLPFGQSTESSG